MGKRQCCYGAEWRRARETRAQCMPVPRHCSADAMCSHPMIWRARIAEVGARNEKIAHVHKGGGVRALNWENPPGSVSGCVREETWSLSVRNRSRDAEVVHFTAPDHDGEADLD